MDSLVQARAEVLEALGAQSDSGYVQGLFAPGAGAHGSQMAGRTKQGIGEPVTVALQASILAADLLVALGR